MAILKKSTGIKFDEEIKETLSNLEESQGDPINALPEYKTRTMKDDLAELGLKKLEKEAEQPSRQPKELSSIIEEKTEILTPEIAEIKKAPLPTTEELITESVFAKPFEKPEILRPEIPKPTSPKLVSPDLKKPSTSVAAKRKKPKILIFLIILILILSGIGGFFYWQNLKQPPTPKPPTEQPEPSASLILVDEIKIISLTKQTSLFNLLKQETDINQPLNSFKRIAILKNEKEFLPLAEFFQELEINIPSSVLSELKDNYSLVLFHQFTGKRLGLIIEIKNAANLKEQLKSWEKTMVGNFKNFYPSQAPGQPSTEEFLDAIFLPVSETNEEIVIRYINLPEPSLALNYAIADNLLVIGASKEIMYKIIDEIFKKKLTINWQTYQNKKYNFELKLPPTWKDFQATEADTPSTDYYPHTKALYFNLPLKDEGFGNAFIILLFTPSEWQELLQKNPACKGGTCEAIDQNDKYVVGYSIMQGVYEFRDITIDKVSEDISKIITSFKIFQ